MVVNDQFDRFYQSKRVLITGDTGFKGSWLAIWLQAMGADVYGYALPPKNHFDNYSICGLSKIIKHEDGDIRDSSSLLAFIRHIQPDIVFHLAAQAIVLESYNNPRETFETNVIGTVNVLDACREVSSVKCLINITSDKCYENQEWYWGYRESDRIGGKDPYSASKGCAEIVTSSYINSFYKRISTSLASVRAGNVIGAGDWGEHRIVPDYFRSLISGDELLIRNPLSVRPWQHVLEPLSGYLKLAKLMWSDKSFQGAWNFGPAPGGAIPVIGLINEFNKYSSKVKVNTPDSIQALHESSLLKLDVSKAAELLKWKPGLSFEETVKLTIEGYLSDINNTPSLENRINTIDTYLMIRRGANNEI